ncbi:hypothetical protein BU16DRAFT_304325 [Lophium mytilinum]|uniref:Uncharacterized protein n=1 Tax=Lophium mytilinum TaxID=390894 RepID=A0A6A6R2I3_9PEZI|nr:hypothetical protein BU16DRAFT_304325 [Lophium mytilinum]
MKIPKATLLASLKAFQATSDGIRTEYHFMSNGAQMDTSLAPSEVLQHTIKPRKAILFTNRRVHQATSNGISTLPTSGSTEPDFALSRFWR